MTARLLNPVNAQLIDRGLTVMLLPQVHSGSLSRVVAVELDGASAIEADVVVLAMGPWSSQIRCVARIRRTRPIWGLVLVSLHEFVFEDLLNRILGAIESDLRPGNGHGPGAVST